MLLIMRIVEHNNTPVSTLIVVNAFNSHSGVYSQNVCKTLFVKTFTHCFLPASIQWWIGRCLLNAVNQLLLVVIYLHFSSVKGNYFL